MIGTHPSGNLALDFAPAISFDEPGLPPSSWCGTALSEPTVSFTYQVIKRGLDICGALIGLMIFALMLPIIALLMYCEGRGPLYYKQKRVGQNGQPFTLYKLRSMIVDADDYLARHPELREAWQRNGKLAHDPRITKLGRFLRKSSIDELPQLFNVLCGDMSLVGPRAIQYSEIKAFGELNELRHIVKPGLTGLWQVSGRSTTDYQQRCILDCTYVMDCSLQMDIKILCKTLPVVFHQTGAY